MKLVAGHEWLALSALIIGALVRIMKSETFAGPLARIPAKWRPVIALGLGITSGVIDAIVNGTKWQTAVVSGLISATIAISAHEVGIETLRNGKEPFAPKDQ